MAPSDNSTARDPGIDELKAQLDQVRADIRILAEMAKESAAANTRRARDAAEDQAQALSSEAQRLLSEAKDEGRRMADEAEGYARNNPLTVLAGAFAVGWLVGSALRR